MTRINSNTTSLLAQRALAQNNAALTKSLERLSTGIRINRGGDDPAGLIVGERLRSEQSRLEAAIGNSQRADQVVNIAEGGLTEISALLLEAQSLVSQNGNDAGLSADEKEANQQQIDQIIATVDRIASVTTFNGLKLLNGAFDFTTTNVSANLTDYEINAAKFEDNSTVVINAIITQSAQHAGLYLSTNGDINLSAPGNSFSIEIAGALGTRQFTFGSGTTLAAAAASINGFKTATGVSAVVSGVAANNSGLVLKSTSYGSNQFVSVKVLNEGGINDVAGGAGAEVGIYLLSSVDENTAAPIAGFTSYAGSTGTIRDDGQDVGAAVNGIAARGKGLEISIATDALDLKLTLDAATGTAAGTLNALSITGGGAKFNLGTEVNLANQIRLGLPNVAARNLGNQALGFLNSIGTGGALQVTNTNNVDAAQKVVGEAILQVAKLRGRLGAFQGNVIQSTIRTLGIAFENTTAAVSLIRDTDFAKETSELTRAQILVAASSNALKLANQSAQNILGLLG